MSEPVKLKLNLIEGCNIFLILPEGFNYLDIVSYEVVLKKVSGNAQTHLIFRGPEE